MYNLRGFGDAFVFTLMILVKKPDGRPTGLNDTAIVEVAPGAIGSVL